MGSAASVLALFHPLVRAWFERRLGQPTDVQARAWPHIAAGEHVLATAPTGSGKTLCAFLWALDRLARAGGAERGGTRVLYVSPLKALNNDIRQNLLEPLAELRETFAQAGAELPPIRVEVRSGDTDPAERRRMLRHPPEIFITTPESLNILLASDTGRRSLTGFGTVILDEVHAVAASKRGAYLMSAVERLTALSGEFQRIALSATVEPLELVAQVVGAYELVRSSRGHTYRPRPVTIVRSPADKRYDLKVHSAAPPRERALPGELWQTMIDDFCSIIAKNRTTLFFCRSRRMAEKIARLINDTAGRDLAYSHHGSLSREIREVVERRFKAGELAAIVATSSLELGIDIGSVDEVVLVQAPLSVSSAVQRIGRAGHAVGRPSRGTFVPLHGGDLVESAVLAKEALAQRIEPVTPVARPLDVLAQVILAEASLRERAVAELHAELRAAWCFHDLTERELLLVVDMLAGRYAHTRIRELTPRLTYDRERGTIRAREGTRSLLFLSGGVIPDRGYFRLRIAGSRAVIGELDEEFVWERSIGEAFPFGNQIWRIERVTHDEVEVVPASRRTSIVPFWRAEPLDLPFQLSERISLFLEEANGALTDERFRERLLHEFQLEPEAAVRLLEYLRRQRQVTGTPLPHRHHLLVEHLREPGNEDETYAILHTMWGGRVNRPFALALGAAASAAYGAPVRVFATNQALLAELPTDADARGLVSLVRPEALTALVRQSLEASSFFGARFRENAQRALLLPRRRFGERIPLFVNRQRARRLLEAVAAMDDFPIVLETWRDCLVRELDLASLARLLGELATGEIRVSEVASRTPSPFAEGVVWTRTNTALYENDAARGELRTRLFDELLDEVLHSAALRPRLPDALIEQFRRRLARLEPGFAPDTAHELLVWVTERGAIPEAEWRELGDAIERDTGKPVASFVSELGDAVVEISHGGARLIATKGEAARVVAALAGAVAHAAAPEREPGPGFLPAPPAERTQGDEATAVPAEQRLAGFLAEWLRFYGPLTAAAAQRALGLSPAAFASALPLLIENDAVLVDRFREDAPGAPAPVEICDRENLERLLRLRRLAARPAFEPLPVAALPLFLAAHQGLAPRAGDATALSVRLEQLAGLPAKAGLWEAEILPARLHGYRPEWLDSLMARGDLTWFGCGRERLAFAATEGQELFVCPPHPAENEMESGAAGASEGEGEGEGEGERKSESDGKSEGGAAESKASTQAQPEPEVVARVAGVFAQALGRLSFGDLQAATGVATESLSRSVWELAWRGVIANDTFEAVRRALATRFRANEAAATMTARPSRGRFSRWRAGRPSAGTWYRVATGVGPPLDAIDREEVVKERVRMVLARYGVLFRELLADELPDLRWAALFRTLRTMELSGEIVTGRFFNGIPGVQFATPAAARDLAAGLPEDTIYWLNAADPASLCGRDIPGLKGALPPRLATTHLVYHGRKLVLVARRSGRELDISVPVDAPELSRYLEVFRELVGRAAAPLAKVLLERINGVTANDSAYAEVLVSFGFERDYRSLVLWRTAAGR